MLNSVQTTIPAENRDFSEWRRGRETYAVWVLPLEEAAIRTIFQAAREHLDGHLLKPYQRQPHITLFVCGFLVEEAQYNDDFTWAHILRQVQELDSAQIQPFEIEVGGLNSFASAPFLEISDPQGGIGRLRETLSGGAPEFRTAPYTPHLTVGLYAGAFPSSKLLERMLDFPVNPIKLRVERITFATYRAQEIAGLLTYRQEVRLVKEVSGI